MNHQRKLDLIELEWLLDHHITKEEERQQMVDLLNLKPGDNVLDLGCGPGLWAIMMAEKVKPDGKVIGADFSSELLKYAVENIPEYLENIIEYQKADFYNVHFDDQTFDLIFFGNCFAYVLDHPKIMEEMKRLTKKGGRIAAKDFDGAIIIFHPIDADLCMRVMAATAKAFKENPSEHFFDNYVGRKLHGIFLKSGLKNISTKTYAIQKLYPLLPEAKRYITGNAEWYAKIGSPYLSKKDVEEWKAYFDPKSDKYILDSEEFYFCMLEVLAIGTVL